MLTPLEDEHKNLPENSDFVWTVAPSIQPPMWKCGNKIKALDSL